MGEYNVAVLDRVFSAVADPTRRSILSRLSESDARVTDLAAAFPISLNSTSKHIRVLERADLVHRTVRGREHILTLDAAPLADAAGWIDFYRRFWSEQLAALDAFVTGRDPGRTVHVTDDYTVTIRREIAAPAEPLFDAWLDAASLGTWLRPGGTTETRAETDPREGGTFRIVMVDDGNSILHTGTYREIDRPHRLVFTWSSPATAHRDSVVTVTFRPTADATVVEVHQVGLPDDESCAGHHRGWSDALRELDHKYGTDADTGRER